MANILITGMTAQQCSPVANARGTTFAGLIRFALTSAGHKVTLVQAETTWTTEDIAKYDSVLVGLAPMTSLSANFTYGALHVLALAGDKAVTFIDAPEPGKISASLRSIAKDPLSLSKTLYTNRKGYKTSDLGSLVNVCNRLSTDEWRMTLYPALPWGTNTAALTALPSGSHDTLVSINLDPFIEVANVEVSKVEKWAADYPGSRWTKRMSEHLSFPVVPMKWNKGWTDTHVVEQIASSAGSLVSSHRGGTWWTPRIMQSLLVGTPVATDWHQSSVIGSAWTILPAGIEVMTPSERYNLAMHQLSEYLAKTPSKTDSVEKLETCLKLRLHKETK